MITEAQAAGIILLSLCCISIYETFVIFVATKIEEAFGLNSFLIFFLVGIIIPMLIGGLILIS